MPSTRSVTGVSADTIDAAVAPGLPVVHRRVEISHRLSDYGPRADGTECRSIKVTRYIRLCRLLGELLAARLEHTYPQA